MPGRRLPLMMSSLLVFAAMFSFGMLLQLKLRELGASLLLIGLLTTVRGAVETFGSPAWGAISDGFKKRRYFLLVTTAVPGVLYFFFSVIEIPAGFIMLSGLIAFFTAGFEPIAMALSTERSRDSVRNTSRELSLLNSANSMGMFSGRLLLALLLLFFTVSMTIKWFASLALIAAIPILFVREGERKTTHRKGFLTRLFPLTSDASPLLKNGLWAVYMGTLLRQLGIAGATSIIAVYLTETVGLSGSLTAAITAINPFMQIFSHIFFGRIIYRIGARKSTLFGIGLTVVSVLCFAFAWDWMLIAAGYFTLGIAFGAFINGAGTMIALGAPPERRAEFLGLLRSSRAVGFMIGPLVAGTIAEISFFAMFVTMGILALIGGIIVAAFTRNSPIVVQ